MSGRPPASKRSWTPTAIGRGRRALVAVVAGIVGIATAIVLPAGVGPTGAAPTDGPGGPVLVLTSPANPFSGYLAEILRNEGLNAFDVADVASLSPELLEAHEVVLLGEVAVDPAQVAALSSWVTTGGNLIAMRPDPDLAGLVGLTDTGSDLSDAYLAIDATAGTPGAGLVDETIQFHGTADLTTPGPGTEVLASLAPTADTVGAHPAATLRTVGSEGGQVAAFTFDVARSVVLTRQGNPAWAGQERDGQQPPIIRADDLFFPDWVDLDKVQIPQADELQRLLANTIEHVSSDVLPIPRFWYLPRGERAAVVMTGDDHGATGTRGQFDWALSTSPPGCAVDEWECVRGTSYVYTGTSLTDAEVSAYQAQGFEVGLHVNTGCADWTPASLEGFYATQLADFADRFPSLDPPATNRTHCITWSDWATQPKVELAEGIRLDTNYYYWPGAWAANRPGHFTGSAMPMRFADDDGALIDVYQAATQMPDESGFDDALHIGTLLDNALGEEGYYGVVTTNMHTDHGSHPGQQAVVGAAQSRGVPVVSAAQMLTWLDGRNGSSFEDLEWDGDALGFSVDVAPGADGLQVMLPTRGRGGSLEALSLDGSPVPFTTEVVKGIEYAVFTGAEGAYRATYGIDATAPTITDLDVVVDAPDAATVTWTTDEPSTSLVELGPSADALAPVADDPALTTAHEVRLTGLTAATAHHLRVTSRDEAGNGATMPPPPATTTFSTPSGLAVDTTVADFAAGTTGEATYVAHSDDGEVLLAPALATELDGTGLPPGWSTATWSGGTTSVAGGRASVDGSWFGADQQAGPGRALEFEATFSGAAFQNAGLGVDLDGAGESWALFGTNATSGVLRARTLDVGGSPVDVALGSQYMGSPHRYRIEWTASSVSFSIDGTVVHTAPTVSGTMRPIASDFATGGGSLEVDWVRTTPHATAGSFASRVHDSGSIAGWGRLSLDADLPGGTALDVSVRTGPTPVPDGAWSPFVPVADGDEVGATGRYLQYRLDASSSSDLVSPEVRSVSVLYDGDDDVAPPTVLARTPSPGATDVPLGSTVSVTFDEPVQPGSDWASAFRLRADGASSDVPATVDAVGPVVTLVPDGDLAPGTVHTVTVDGSVADAAGNALGAPVSWSFTTATPPGEVVDDTAADFGAGTTGPDTYVAVTGDGEVTLAPHDGIELEGGGVPAGWTSTLWAGGPGGSTVADGSIAVDGALLAPTGVAGPGRSIEVRATFGAQSFQHVGFGVDLDSVAAWAMFSTAGSAGSTLYARTHDGSSAVSVPLGPGLVGTPHDYRIDWTGDAVVFRVDGVVVHTQPVAIATAMRPVISDFAAGGPAVVVEWLRASPYTPTGTFTSRVLDAGGTVDWGALDLDATTPSGSSVQVGVRTGPTPIPDGSWSSYALVEPGTEVPGTSRYVQYRLEASTTDPAVTPVVDRVALAHVPVLPVVSAGAAVVSEGDVGSVTVEVPVRLSAPSAQTVTVGWATGAGPLPTPGVDFEAASGTVTFAPGQVEATITVTVLGDVVDEPGQLWGAEWLGIFLSSPSGAVFGPGFLAHVGLVLIADDDPPPVVSAGAAVVSEGDAGSVTVEVPVRLSAPSAQTVTVGWATGAGPLPTPGVDFEAASGTVTFAPGQVEATITVTVLGDVVDEPGQLWGAEWLGIFLSSPSGAVFGPGFLAHVGLVFIVDDD